MRRKRKLRVKIYDETHLTEVGGFYLSKSRIFFFCAALVIVLVACGICIIAFTPLRNSLPGYMKADQRSATLEGLMRLDSLMVEHEKNQAYIENFLKVTDTTREPDGIVDTIDFRIAELQSDTLMSRTERERKFVEKQLEKENYNVSVIAPLAAEGTRFYPVSPEGVFTEQSKSSAKGSVAMPKGSTVNAIADGTVISVSSPNLNSIYVITLQHPNGFLSRLTGSGKPLAAEGEKVSGGQPLAQMPSKNSGNNTVTVELWHNGEVLVPYLYLK